MRSDRHFTGDHEDSERQSEGSEVINTSYFVEFGINYQFNKRFFAALNIPYSNHNRSQTVRANNAERTILERYDTQSSGLGDIRLTGNAWLFDPGLNPRCNIMLGLGLDMPTGEDDVTDTHRRLNTATGRVENIKRAVDQSIQPGDGGWGIPIDLFAYYRFTDSLMGFIGGSYMITPEETNGTKTGRGNPYEAEMSIPDTFGARVGLNYALFPDQGISVSLATRAEGVPVYDLFGGSNGFRRPGIAVSVEPGISWAKHGWSASLSVPISVYRNRFRSLPDKQFSNSSGVYRHGDAAFADFLILLSIGKQF